MTADYIAFHAAERPDAVAFIDNERAITYSRFNRDIRQFMRALREFGLRRGSWAGIGCANLYLHWVLLLAFERFGIATASFDRHEGPDARRQLESLDIVLSEWEFPGATIKRHHAITRQWIEYVRGLPEIGEAALPLKAEDDIVRILRTTGTTGDPKLLRSPRRTQDAWDDVWIWNLGLTNRSRYLITIPFNVHTIYTLATGVIRAGATVILETRRHIAEAMSVHAITHVALFPIHLRTILDTLPDGFVKPANLSVTCFGATLSEALRERAMARLATDLYDNYGSHEIGFASRIASSGSGGIGTVSPVAQVEVVDEQGSPMPLGQLGRLRIKTPFMHTEYFDDPEATRRIFKDGWFQSGDLAILHGPRRLQLMGRSDEMLNVGGNKVPPSAVEDLVLRIVNAKDAGAFSSQNREGIEEIWIAVADAQVDDKELRERIERGLHALQFATFHLVRLPEIPRNPGGKIQRDLLKRAVAGARELLPGADR
jgi:acyl-coenzyme A synthetase/AMP-(fatty) acid ligase